jgi:hypothetical protein
MKKVILAALAVIGLSTAAHADTVSITSVVDMMTPPQPAAISSSNTYHFVGTNQIVFKVAGKTCSFVGSATAIGPIGCNYSLTVNESTGALSNPVSNSNPGCTQASQMIASCK